MLHVLNLAAQAVAGVFHKKKPAGGFDSNDKSSDTDKHALRIDFDQEVFDAEDVNDSDFEHAPSWSLDDEEEEELLSEIVSRARRRR
ncbi:hypothetical protein RhiJN_24864 [Ceratobasidium sp. AG-Ba]|nr:hypothetical protein RhiJN_24864 [Ceratobasidium sp. AG-Ba]